MYWAIVSVCLCGVALFSGAYWWAARRGFDFTDEAIFFLQALRPQDVKCYPLFDFVYSHKVFVATRGSIVFHRKLLLVLSLVYSSIFAYGATSSVALLLPDLDVNFSLQCTIWGLVFVANLMRFAFGPRILYYNNLNSFGLLAGAGLSLVALSNLVTGNLSLPVACALVLLGGFLQGIQLFSRITSGIATICSLLLLYLALPSISLKAATMLGLSLVVGNAGWVIVHFSFFQSFQSWRTAFTNQLKTAALFGWGTNCLDKHVKDVVQLMSWLCSYYARPLIALLVPLVAMNFTSKTEVLVGLSIIGCFAAFKFKSRKKSESPLLYADSQEAAIELCMKILGVAILISLFQVLPAKPMNWAVTDSTLTALFLFALPFIGAVGTGNPLYVVPVFQVAPWIVLSFVLLLSPNGLNLPTAILTLGGGIYVTLFATKRLLFHQYRVIDTMFEQDTPCALGQWDEVLLLDKRTAQVITELRMDAAANGFKKGDDVIVLFDGPGFVYALGGVSPGHQWYYRVPVSELRDKMNDANCWHLEQAGLARIKRAFLIQSGEMDSFEAHFIKLGIEPVKHFMLCSSYIFPFTRNVLALMKPYDLVSPSDEVGYATHIMKAGELLGQELLEEAIEELDAAIVYPKCPVAANLSRANLLLRVGRYDDAIVGYNEIILKDHQNVIAWCGLARAFLEKKNMDAVAKIFADILSHSLNHPEVQALRELVSQSSFERAREIGDRIAS